MIVKKAIFIAFMLLLFWHRTLVAEPTILIKGLTDHKAILLVDGQLIILRKGQPKQNMTLLSADNNKAIINVNGVDTEYHLDTGIANTFSVPDTNPKTQKPKILYKESIYLRLTGSRVKQVTLVEDIHNQIKLEIDYVYNGEQGTNADISTSIINNGKFVKNIVRQFHNLEKGENKLEIIFDMSKSKDIVFYTEAVNFVFLARKETTKTFYTKTVQLKKYWKKVRVR